MKVQYTQDFTTTDGFEIKKGWTVEHDDAVSAVQIAAGLCVQVDDAAYPRRQEQLVFECAVPTAPTPITNKSTFKF